MARPRKGITFWDRVYSLVERSGECLLFTGCKDECGYGRINREGKLVRLHREVWARDHGPVPHDLVVMHTCDNPPCIEPSHLQIGTQVENLKDMDAKGRRVTARGSAQGLAKLCENDIPIIRHWLSEGYSKKLIAEKFGVTSYTISDISLKRTWHHVGSI